MGGPGSPRPHESPVNMSYQPMTPRLADIPTDRHDLARSVTYRSPTRLSGMVTRKKDIIIEVSDDESDNDPPPQQSPSQQSLRRRPLSTALPSISSSDADVSDTEFELDARLARPTRTLKRTWTPSSSSAGSPQIAPGDRGKRRANPPSSCALGDMYGKEASPGLQPQHHRFSRDGAVPEQAFTGSSLNNITQRYTESGKKKTKKKKKATQQPPYYVDGRLDVKMYRGPGYERFPVVLGTVEGHQELCDRWDAEKLLKLERKATKLRQAIRTPYVIHDSDSESSDDEAEGDGKTAFEKKCLASVIDVFPDIERAYVEKKIQDAPPQPQYFNQGDLQIVDITVPPIVEQIIMEILEMQSYPKQRPTNRMAPAKGAAEDGTGVTITWNRDLPKDQMYTKDAIILLAKNFVNVPSHYIAKVVEEKKSIFDSYVTILGQEDQYYSLQPRPYKRYIKPRTELEKKYMLSAGDRRIPAEYANRVNELQAAKQFFVREGIKEAAKKAKEEAEALNLAEHIKTGAIMECQCCFDTETPLNRIVSCMADVPHFFCFTCVEGLADNQVGMLKYEMRCMDAGGCTAELSHEDIGRAVPITTFDRLELNKQQAEIMAANIEGLEQCSCCEYRAICLDVVQEPIFYCQNPECARATCRRCRKDSHAPKSCEESNRDKTLSARHLVEEARSEAIIRTCPKCKAKILKDFGCNKMRCTRCSCLMCYICHTDITHLGNNAYSHFGGKCVLYDEQGINRHESEANEAEKGAITKAKAMDAELDERQLRIDTDKPKQRPSALLNHPAAEVFLRDLNNRAARLDNRQARLRELQVRVNRLQAFRRDPELEDILAGIHRLEGARGHEGGPPPNSEEYMQQLLDLHRRAQLNLAQHQLDLHEQLQHQRHLDGQLQQPAPAAPRTAAHNQYPAAPNPAVNPPILFPFTHYRPAPAAAAFSDLGRPGDNAPNGTNQGRPFGNFDFNSPGVRVAMLDPIPSNALTGVGRGTPRRHPATQPPGPHGLYLEVPGSGASSARREPNHIYGPAGAALPAQGLQTQTLPIPAALAAHNTPLGIARSGAGSEAGSGAPDFRRR
ncbi:hypothetical protein CLAIMM_08188 [Cladophialophora immunda]|nr:hypothetical protein CLAIMM_08188 [Cladophialophora immunda]